MSRGRRKRKERRVKLKRFLNEENRRRKIKK